MHCCPCFLIVLTEMFKLPAHSVKIDYTYLWHLLRVRLTRWPLFSWLLGNLCTDSGTAWPFPCESNSQNQHAFLRGSLTDGNLPACGVLTSISYNTAWVYQ